MRTAMILVGMITLAVFRAFAGEKESLSLKDIVPESSNLFVCHFGKFEVKMLAEKGTEKLVMLSGKGLMINSGWLHYSVGSGSEIRNVFSNAADISDGSIVTVYCSGKTPYDQKNKIGHVDFYVTGR